MSKAELESMLTNVVKGALEAEIKERGLDKIDTKFAALPAHLVGVTAEELSKMDKKQKVAKFVKSVFQRDLASLMAMNTKAMTEGTGSAGGFIVPEEFAAEVNRVVEDFGLIAKLGRRYPMKSDTLNVPRLSASVSITYPGEATAGTASQPTLQNVQLLAKTCVGITPMSNELLADANVSVVDLLVELFAEAIAGELDNQGLAGSGSPFTGLLTDTGVNVLTASSGDDTFTEAATPDYCRQLIAKVKPWALQGACFIMHRDVWAIIQQKKASSGGDYFVSAANPVLSGLVPQGFPSAVAGTLWGYPVLLSDKMPTTTAVSTKFILFGNLKHVYYGVRDEMAMSISEHATVGSDNLFEKNMSAVRITARHAVAVGLPAAFAALKTAAS